MVVGIKVYMVANDDWWNNLIKGGVSRVYKHGISQIVVFSFYLAVKGIFCAGVFACAFELIKYFEDILFYKISSTSALTYF